MIKMNVKKICVLVFGILLFCCVSFALPPKITEPHTRFNPWMNECVYFFTYGQCYVDPDHCSKDYGENAMEDVLVELDREKECMYSREEYHEYLKTKKEKVERVINENIGPFRFVVEETEYVRVLPKGYDPDEDGIEYTFTSPLDDSGEWQTTYGDAGEYTATVSVSDGELSSSKDFDIIVTKKEESPVIEEFNPSDGSIEVDEGSGIDFSVVVSDKNGDELSYVWKVDGEEVSTSRSYRYDPSHMDAGEHIIEVIISDGVNEIRKRWVVTVRNVNRKPELVDIGDITVKETETVVLEPSATDEDGEGIAYTISEPVGNDGIWETTYDDAGEYTVTVSVSDGIDEVSKDVKITVENVNRAPVIVDVWNEE